VKDNFFVTRFNFYFFFSTVKKKKVVPTGKQLSYFFINSNNKNQQSHPTANLRRYLSCFSCVDFNEQVAELSQAAFWRKKV